MKVNIRGKGGKHCNYVLVETCDDTGKSCGQVSAVQNILISFSSTENSQCVYLKGVNFNETYETSKINNINLENFHVDQIEIINPEIYGFHVPIFDENNNIINSKWMMYEEATKEDLFNALKLQFAKNYELRYRKETK